MYAKMSKIVSTLFRGTRVGIHRIFSFPNTIHGHNLVESGQTHSANGCGLLQSKNQYDYIVAGLNHTVI